MADVDLPHTEPPDSTLRRRCRQIAHYLRPVVQVGDGGLSDGVIAELDRALNDHELIKVKVVGDRASRAVFAEAITSALKAHRVQQIGGMLILLRRNPKPNPKLSNLVRYTR